ncbi:hypothetical protein VKT23_020262 [Stygiomarasmius scandens]|uniref:Deacetylase sirtuin-type domain-containing protein n=1 Tax=Marasmiellus scandens TaxID=2682957 RepID=A0ABR1IKQ5_9AGAR
MVIDVQLFNSYTVGDMDIQDMMQRDISAKPDLLLVVGTSLKIPGARRFVETILAGKETVTVELNEALLPQDLGFTYRLQLDCQEFASRMLRLMNLSQDYQQEYSDTITLTRSETSSSVFADSFFLAFDPTKDNCSNEAYEMLSNGSPSDSDSNRMTQCIDFDAGVDDWDRLFHLPSSLPAKMPMGHEEQCLPDRIQKVIITLLFG